MTRAELEKTLARMELARQSIYLDRIKLSQKHRKISEIIAKVAKELADMDAEERGETK